MNKTRFKWMICFCIGLISPPLTAYANDYVVAVEALDYMPLYDGSKSNAYHGFARDLLDLFGKRYKHTFKYQPLPVNRLFAEFYMEGKYDFKFPDNPAWQDATRKNKTIVYSDPVITLTEGLFIPEKRVKPGKRNIKYIATIAGFTPTPYLPLIESGQLTVYTTNSFSSLFQMSMVERVDGIYTNAFAVKYFQKHQPASQEHLVLDKSSPYITTVFSLATTKHPEVIAQFNRFLRDENGEIAKLRSAYGITAEMQ